MKQSLYKEMESRTIQNFNLRCIDGTIRGCGKCVGFCSYERHSGFLTAQMKQEHKCREKGCFYYCAKPSPEKREKHKGCAIQSCILTAAKTATAEMEGLRVLRVAAEMNGEYTVYYVAIAGYDVAQVEAIITEVTGYQAHMRKIACDFNVAVSLVVDRGLSQEHAF